MIAKEGVAPLAELRRVLKPGGRLILSINHPTVSVITQPAEDYFANRQYPEDYEFDGEPAALTFWHRRPRRLSPAAPTLSVTTS